MFRKTGEKRSHYVQSNTKDTLCVFSHVHDKDLSGHEGAIRVERGP